MGTIARVRYSETEDALTLILKADTYIRLIRPLCTDAFFDTRMYCPYVRVSKNAPEQTALTYGSYVRVLKMHHVLVACVSALNLNLNLTVT